MTTDRTMLDVLRSTTREHGEVCVIAILAGLTHKWPALCLDLGDLAFSFQRLSNYFACE